MNSPPHAWASFALVSASQSISRSVSLLKTGILKLTIYMVFVDRGVADDEAMNGANSCRVDSVDDRHRNSFMLCIVFGVRGARTASIYSFNSSCHSFEFAFVCRLCFHFFFFFELVSFGPFIFSLSSRLLALPPPALAESMRPPRCAYRANDLCLLYNAFASTSRARQSHSSSNSFMQLFVFRKQTIFVSHLVMWIGALPHIRLSAISIHVF